MTLLITDQARRRRAQASAARPAAGAKHRVQAKFKAFA